MFDLFTMFITDTYLYVLLISYMIPEGCLCIEIYISFCGLREKLGKTCLLWF